MNTITALVRGLGRLMRAHREWARARRDYRDICENGSSPVLQVDIRLHPDRADWATLDVSGITGYKGVVKLTPGGHRTIAKTVKDIEQTCIRQIRYDNRVRADRKPVRPRRRTDWATAIFAGGLLSVVTAYVLSIINPQHGAALAITADLISIGAFLVLYGSVLRARHNRDKDDS